MIAAATTHDGDALAGALLARAASVLPRLDAIGREVPLVAVERFLEDLSPSAFLAAAGALVRASRAAAIERLDGEGGRRAFAVGLGAVRDAGLPEHLLERLAGLRETRAEGGRLEALAALLSAWRELAGRVEEDTERLRRDLRAAGLRGRRRGS